MGSLKVRSLDVRDSKMPGERLLLLHSRTQWHPMRILAMTGPILHRIMRDAVVHQLQLDHSVIILNDFVPEEIFLIYNDWFRTKSVQSNREYEFSVGEARRLSHSASYLLSPNSSNHCSIALNCLKFSKSMSSKTLRHLTCLQTRVLFWRGSIHFA
jgi:hypothetical protein